MPSFSLLVIMLFWLIIEQNLFEFRVSYGPIAAVLLLCSFGMRCCCFVLRRLPPLMLFP